MRRRLQQERAYGRALSAAAAAFAPDVLVSSNNPLLSQQVLLRTCERLGLPFVFWQQDIYSVAMARVAKSRYPLLGSMMGRYVEAKTAADSMATRLMPHAKTMPMLDTFIMTPLWVDARFNKWDAILARSEPFKELPGTHAMWRYSRTLAFVAWNKKEKAVAERAEFAKEAASFPADANIGEFNSGKVVLELAAHILDARLATAQADKDASIAHWKQAVAIQDTLKYDEPPDWYYPVRESLGAAYLAAGNPAEAEKIFRDDLLRNPRNPRSLFGLTQALRAQNRDADAAWTESQFKTAWKSADTELHLPDL